MQKRTTQNKGALPPGSVIGPAQWRVLTREFFDRVPEVVAPQLLGKILVRRGRGKLLAGRVVETEAYLGEHDPAAHAASGRSARNDVLYGPPGFAYVYQIYGMHFCLNVSCLPDGTPGGVLFRALEPLMGVAEMQKNRGIKADGRPRVAASGLTSGLTSGPGKLCRAFGITRAAYNGADLIDPAGPLALYDDGFVPAAIETTPRIGIRKAADLPLRFLLAGHSCVSASPRRR